jgi:hypothetical protein
VPGCEAAEPKAEHTAEGTQEPTTNSWCDRQSEWDEWSYEPTGDPNNAISSDTFNKYIKFKLSPNPEAKKECAKLVWNQDVSRTYYYKRNSGI